MGNKVEAAKNRRIDHKDIIFFLGHIAKFLLKTGYQCEKSLLYLLRMMANSDKIELLREFVPKLEDSTTLIDWRRNSKFN